MRVQDRTPERLGPYRLVRQLGAGGMGVVYLAEDEAGALVAVKALHPSMAEEANARRRLAREVETMRRVRSRYVAQVLGADLDGEPPYIVTRYVPGLTLEAVVGAGGPLTQGALARLARGLAEALAAVHAAGVVHRDLKPGNVMISDGEPVVIDFGIAHVPETTRLTMTGMFMGTPGYLAPEVIEGKESGPACDIHSWAATVAFAATGRPPFGTGPYEGVFYRIVHGQPDLDALPEPLRPMVMRALSRDPALRPSAAELAGWAAALDPDTLVPAPAARAAGGPALALGVLADPPDPQGALPGRRIAPPSWPDATKPDLPSHTRPLPPMVQDDVRDLLPPVGYGSPADGARQAGVPPAGPGLAGPASAGRDRGGAGLRRVGGPGAPGRRPGGRACPQLAGARWRGMAAWAGPARSDLALEPARRGLRGGTGRHGAVRAACRDRGGARRARRAPGGRHHLQVPCQAPGDDPGGCGRPRPRDRPVSGVRAARGAGARWPCPRRRARLRDQRGRHGRRRAHAPPAPRARRRGGDARRRRRPGPWIAARPCGAGRRARRARSHRAAQGRGLRRRARGDRLGVPDRLERSGGLLAGGGPARPARSPARAAHDAHRHPAQPARPGPPARPVGGRHGAPRNSASGLARPSAITSLASLILRSCPSQILNLAYRRSKCCLTAASVTTRAAAISRGVAGATNASDPRAGRHSAVMTSSSRLVSSGGDSLAGSS